MMRRIAILSGVFCALYGCSTLSFDHKPVHHTPFAENRWKTSPWETPEGAVVGAPQKEAGIREKMVAAALALLEKGEKRPDFGDTALYDILEKTGQAPKWRPSDGLASLKKLAERRGAYCGDGMPAAGDIALFHNQRDIDGNGENDDWLTGGGVVVVAGRARFEVITRTGNAPRRVFVWTAHPSYRLYKGEVANSFVRVPARTDPPDTAYLAGQLYAGHIDVVKLLSP